MSRVACLHRSDAFFCFHNVNAFDDGDDLVIDLLAYDDMSILYQVELSALRENPSARHDQAPPYLRRCVDCKSQLTKGNLHTANSHKHSKQTLQTNTPNTQMPTPCPHALLAVLLCAQTSAPHRIRLPAVSDAIAKGPTHRTPASMRTTCSALQLELPRINPAVQCKDYQYTWCFAQVHRVFTCMLTNANDTRV